MHEPSERLAKASLYLCTDARRERGDLAEFADAALAGGVDIIQLRDKGSPGEQRFGPLEARARAGGARARWPTRPAGTARCWPSTTAPTSRVAAGADVLHLGQDDLPLAIARDIIGPRPLIGRSTHDPAQVAAAVAEDSGLLLRRPVLAHPDQARAGPRPASTWSAPRPNFDTDKPWFAIGGIDAQRLPEVLAAGARRIVVVRAITAADDPRAAAQQLKAALTGDG